MLNPLCRSLMSISPLPLLVPSFPPPNPPLPPELIDQIIRSLPLYPARNRRRALGRCCLVNRLFLDISRPLLYNEVPAMLEEPEEAAGRQLDRLTETLASSSACREMVKGVKLSTYEGELGLDARQQAFPIALSSPTSHDLLPIRALVVPSGRPFVLHQSHLLHVPPRHSRQSSRPFHLPKSQLSPHLSAIPPCLIRHQPNLCYHLRTLRPIRRTNSSSPPPLSTVTRHLNFQDHDPQPKRRDIHVAATNLRPSASNSRSPNL